MAPQLQFVSVARSRPFDIYTNIQFFFSAGQPWLMLILSMSSHVPELDSAAWKRQRVSV